MAIMTRFLHMIMLEGQHQHRFRRNPSQVLGDSHCRKQTLWWSCMSSIQWDALIDVSWIKMQLLTISEFERVYIFMPFQLLTSGDPHSSVDVSYHVKEARWFLHLEVNSRFIKEPPNNFWASPNGESTCPSSGKTEAAAALKLFSNRDPISDFGATITLQACKYFPYSRVT